MKLAKYLGNKKEKLIPVSRPSGPFRPLQRWQREIYRLFGDPFGDWLMPDERFPEDWMPAVNMYEGKDKFVVEAELPGMKKEEIQVYLGGSNLNITGDRKAEREEKGRDTYRAERRFGHFHRVVQLPFAVRADAMEARYRDGILTVVCPKTAVPTEKQIEIKVK
jgi:HSP20 family protein